MKYIYFIIIAISWAFIGYTLSYTINSKEPVACQHSYCIDVYQDSAESPMYYKVFASDSLMGDVHADSLSTFIINDNL